MSKPSLQLGGDWAVKESNLLGYAVGSSGKYVPREFAFERGTDLTATRVNKDGLIEKGRTQLLYNTPWTGGGGSGVSTPSGWTTGGANDGTFSATDEYGRITFSSTVPKIDPDDINDVGDRRYLVTPTQSVLGLYAFSVFVDDVVGTVEVREIMRSNSANNTTKILTLEDGEVVGSTATISKGKRYTLVYTLDSATTVFRVGIGTNPCKNPNVSVTLSKPQLEYGQTFTGYIENTSTSAVKKVGVTEDLPRISYNDGKPQLLIEPKSVNLIPYSEYIGNWAFNGEGQVEYNFNYAISPDGSKNATHYRAANGYRHLRKALTLETDQKYVFSFYVKNIDADRLRARVYNVDDSDDIINSTEGDYFSQVSTEEWRRIEFAFTTDSVDTNYAVYLTDGQTVVQSGSSGGNVLFWGAQLEKYHSHDEATSYIPTYGTTATRTFDKPTFNYDAATKEWTIFMDVEDMTIQGDESNQGHFFFRGRPDNTASALFFFGTCFGYRTTDTTANDYPNKYVCGKLGNSGDVFSGKFAVSYDGNNTMKIYVDGTLDTTITDADPDFAQGIQSGGLSYNDADTNTLRKINKLQIYNEELSQSDCEALTA